MKRYILIGLVLLQSMSTLAQNDNSIPQLMEYLEKYHPEEISYEIIRYDDGYSERWTWEKEYHVKKDKPICRYQLQSLKDTVMQYFLNASSEAIACHHQQTPKGTEDQISYALALDKEPDESPVFVYDHYNAKEDATFFYYPDRDRCRLSVGYHKRENENSNGQALDFKPLEPLIAKIAEEAKGEKYSVSYRYNTQKGEFYSSCSYVLETDSNNNVTKSFEGGDQLNVLEGGCSGTLYVIPQERSDMAATKLNTELLHYLHANRNKEYMYDSPRMDTKTISLQRWNRKIDETYGTIFARKDEFGRYTIFFVEKIDSTLILPKGYETMLSYDHGKVERLPNYETMKANIQNKKNDEYLSWLEKATRQLGISNLPMPQRIEMIGGKTIRHISTWQWEVAQDSINSFRSKIVNGALSNFKHIESHTQQGDTIELTASNAAFDQERLTCKMYGKEGTYAAHMQYLVDVKTEGFDIPFDTRWVNDFITQMKDSNFIEQHLVDYEYGKKSDPSSMGKVEGKLYVVSSKNKDAQSVGATFTEMMRKHLNKNLNQTFDIVFTNHQIHITDRIIALVNPEGNQFALLCIDYVEGKYLIPEEWYRITSYKYGKKRSLTNL